YRLCTRQEIAAADRVSCLPYLGQPAARCPRVRSVAISIDDRLGFFSIDERQHRKPTGSPDGTSRMTKTTRIAQRLLARQLGNAEPDIVFAQIERDGLVVEIP